MWANFIEIVNEEISGRVIFENSKLLIRKLTFPWLSIQQKTPINGSFKNLLICCIIVRKLFAFFRIELT